MATKMVDIREFGKRDKTTRLEVIIRECRNCRGERTHIYLGKENNKYSYSCLYCNNCIESFKRLK